MKKWILAISVLAALGSRAQQQETLAPQEIKDMTLHSQAQSNTLQTDEFTLENKIPNPWELEAQFQSNSISRLALFGPALGFRTSEKTSWGGRFLSSINDRAESATNRLQAFYRYQHNQKANSLISDFNIAYNQSRAESFASAGYTSMGYSVGVKHKFNSEFSAGGSLGAELTAESTDRWNEAEQAWEKTGSSLKLEPSVSFFGQMTF